MKFMFAPNRHVLYKSYGSNRGWQAADQFLFDNVILSTLIYSFRKKLPVHQLHLTKDDCLSKTIAIPTSETSQRPGNALPFEGKIKIMFFRFRRKYANFYTLDLIDCPHAVFVSISWQFACHTHSLGSVKATDSNRTKYCWHVGSHCFHGIGPS